MYLNAYVPLLQSERGVVSFLRFHRGHQFASSALMNPMTVPSCPPSAASSSTRVCHWWTFARVSARTISPVSTWHVSRRGGRALRGSCPGEDPSVPHREAAQPQDGGHLCLDRAVHGDGQPLLRVRRGCELRPLLPPVLYLLPRLRQALQQRPRMGQAAVSACPC